MKTVVFRYQTITTHHNLSCDANNDLTIAREFRREASMSRNTSSIIPDKVIVIEAFGKGYRVA